MVLIAAMLQYFFLSVKQFTMFYSGLKVKSVQPVIIIFCHPLKIVNE